MESYNQSFDKVKEVENKALSDSSRSFSIEDEF
jgi:hypothetical protein